MKAFVTGATGKVGSVLIEGMLDRGWMVDAFVLPEDDSAFIEERGVRVFRGDITDIKALDYAVETSAPEILFHLAGYVQLGGFGVDVDEQRMRDVNVIGTRNVLNSGLRHNVKKAVYISSVAIFTPSNGSNLVTEKTSTGDNNKGSYGQTKYLAHQEALRTREKGLQLLIFMPGIIFGPGFPGTTYMFNLLNEGRIKYLPDIFSSVTVPLVFSRDLSYAIFAGIEKDRFGEEYILVESSPTVQKIAMLVTDLLGISAIPKSISYRKALIFVWVAEAIARFTGRTPRVTRSQLKNLFIRGQGIQYFSKFDASKARNELNWQPTALKDAMKETIDWYATNAANKPQEGN